jgi:fructosamine-3-kinase
VAIPLAYGPLELDSSASFFLTPFRDMSEKTPTPIQLVDVLEKLHKTSVSPNGKFGFHVTTFNGVVPLVNDWCDTWEEYFARQLRSDIQWMHSVRGPSPEFDAVAEEFFQKVIPRLLRPLETGGRSIKPALVHGDIWPGNVQIDRANQRVILFDSCCCYAHNERKWIIVVCSILDIDAHTCFSSRARYDEGNAISIYGRTRQQVQRRRTAFGTHRRL